MNFNFKGKKVQLRETQGLAIYIKSDLPEQLLLKFKKPPKTNLPKYPWTYLYIFEGFLKPCGKEPFNSTFPLQKNFSYLLSLLANFLHIVYEGVSNGIFWIIFKTSMKVSTWDDNEN